MTPEICPTCGQIMPNIKCPKCGNKWFTDSKAEYVSCSKCHTKFKRVREGGQLRLKG